MYNDAITDSSAETASKKKSAIVHHIDTKRKRTRSSISGATSGLKVRLKSHSMTDHGKLVKKTILDEFNQEFNIAKLPLYMVTGDSCPFCKDGQMRNLGGCTEASCSTCGCTIPTHDTSSKSMGYGDDVDYPSFCYKRVNHFTEWLNSFQAKETTIIPDSVIDEIMTRLYIERFRDIDKLTPSIIREVLKKLGHRKYYENTTLICCLLTGRKPPRLHRQAENQLKSMFLAIQLPFEMFCPADRKNFLSYSYCLYKFCELIGLDGFLSCFSLLKGRDKLYKQDQIFEKICRFLDWEFLPSV